MPPQGTAADGKIPVIVHSTAGSATLALIMGLVSIAGLVVPIIGVICGILAILSGRKGMKSSAAGKATAGMVLGIVFLCISALIWIGNAVLFALML